MYIQEQEERDFTHTSVAEWDKFEARLIGERRPECEWISTNLDAWHRNPYFTGCPGSPHPEEDATDEDYEAYRIRAAKWAADRA